MHERPKTTPFTECVHFFGEQYGKMYVMGVVFLVRVSHQMDERALIHQT